MKYWYLVLVSMAALPFPFQPPRDNITNGVLELRVEQIEPSAQAINKNKTAVIDSPLSCSIVIILKNISEESVEFMTTIPEMDFSIQVLDRSGRGVPLTHLGERLPKTDEERASWMLSRQVRKLLPGEEHPVIFNLGLYYQVKPSESYSIRVNRFVAKRELSGNIVKSQLTRSLVVSTARAEK